MLIWRSTSWIHFMKITLNKTKEVQRADTLAQQEQTLQEKLPQIRRWQYMYIHKFLSSCMGKLLILKLSGIFWKVLAMKAFL